MIRVKICGVTTVADAAFAVESGADFVGLNFYAKSPRVLSLDVARTIRKEMPDGIPVGVFVEDSPEQIAQIANDLDLFAVQTYSPVSYSFKPRSHFPAFRVKDQTDRDRIVQTVSEISPEAVLIDSHVPGSLGGTGHKAPWELLVGFDPGVPVILAGGLTPENVAEAIRIVRPWGVDVASGVESSPGIKDRFKVRDFLQAVRGIETAAAGS